MKHDPTEKDTGYQYHYDFNTQYATFPKNLCVLY